MARPLFFTGCLLLAVFFTGAYTTSDKYPVKNRGLATQDYWGVSSLA